MAISVIFGSAVLLIIFFIVKSVYSLIYDPLKHVPGPRFARFSRLWYFLHVRSGQFHHENISLHRRHGSVVRVAPRMYSLNVPDEQVYGIGSKFEKSDWYEGWKHPSPDRWTLFPDRNMKRHADTRKRFQALYSMSSLVSYERHVDDCMSIFMSRIQDFTESRTSFDLAHWFQCYAFDVIGSITYSKRFGFMDEGKDIGNLLSALDNSMIYSTLAGIYSWIHPYAYAIMQRIPGSGAAGRNYLMHFVQQNISERKEKGSPAYNEIGETGSKDFLEKLNYLHEKDSERVTAYHIFMMGLSNIVAGSDTTAVSLSSVLYHLLKRPSTLEALRQEISAARTAGNGFISFKEANAMPYLQAVIKEALRLHPATGLPLWRVVPEDGAFIAGRHFRKGDVVGTNSWVSHYDTNVFGPDADSFRPERWLQAQQGDHAKFKKMEASYMPVSQDVVLYVPC